MTEILAAALSGKPFNTGSPSDAAATAGAETPLFGARPADSSEWPHLNELEVIADWQDDLTRRIRRARLQYDLVGLPPEEIVALSAEKEAFKRACAALRGEWGAG